MWNVGTQGSNFTMWTGMFLICLEKTWLNWTFHNVMATKTAITWWNSTTNQTYFTIVGVKSQMSRNILVLTLPKFEISQWKAGIILFEDDSSDKQDKSCIIRNFTMKSRNNLVWRINFKMLRHAQTLSVQSWCLPIPNLVHFLFFYKIIERIM